jgi:tetratricopeptide (TPR) repeat protein
MLQTHLGPRTVAEQAFRRALEIQESLVAGHPGDTRYRQNLACSYRLLGCLLTEVGQWAEAEQVHRRALSIDEQLVAELLTDTDCRCDLAADYNNLGVLLKDMGQRSAAEQAYRRSIEIKEKLVADFASVAWYRHDLAVSHYNLGNSLKDLEQWSAAESAHSRALSLREKLAADFPSVPKYRQALAESQNGLGLLFLHQRQWPAAQQAFQKAIAVREKLAADFPDVPGYRADLAASYVNAGVLQRDQGDPEASLAAFAKAIALLERLLEPEPRLTKVRLYLRNAHSARAKALDMLGRHANAVKDWSRALEFNVDSAFEPGLRRCRADSLLAQGELAAAEAECRQAVRLQPTRAEHHQALGDVCARSGRWDQALEEVAKAAELERGNDWYCCQLAALQLRVGEVAAYHRTCQEMVQRFRETNQPEVAARTAMACLLLPEVQKSGLLEKPGFLEDALALADRTLVGTETDRRYRYFMLVRALAEHRLGRHAQAVKWLEQIAPNADGGGIIDATIFAVLAMAKHNLGLHADARAALAKAQALVAATRPDPAKGRPFGNDWEDWLRFELLLREAEALPNKKTE